MSLNRGGGAYAGFPRSVLIGEWAAWVPALLTRAQPRAATGAVSARVARDENVRRRRGRCGCGTSLSEQDLRPGFTLVPELLVTYQ